MKVNWMLLDDGESELDFGGVSENELMLLDVGESKLDVIRC